MSMVRGAPKLNSTRQLWISQLFCFAWTLLCTSLCTPKTIGWSGRSTQKFKKFWVEKRNLAGSQSLFWSLCLKPKWEFLSHSRFLFASFLLQFTWWSTSISTEETSWDALLMVLNGFTYKSKVQCSYSCIWRVFASKRLCSKRYFSACLKRWATT